MKVYLAARFSEHNIAKRAETRRQKVLERQRSFEADGGEPHWHGAHAEPPPRKRKRGDA